MFGKNALASRHDYFDSPLPLSLYKLFVNHFMPLFCVEVAGPLRGVWRPKIVGELWALCTRGTWALQSGTRKTGWASGASRYWGNNSASLLLPDVHTRIIWMNDWGSWGAYCNGHNPSPSQQQTWIPFTHKSLNILYKVFNSRSKFKMIELG